MHVSPRPRIHAAATNGLAAAIGSSVRRSDAVLEGAGVDPGSILDPRAMISLADYCGLIDLCAERTGDDAFGARFGSSFELAHFGDLGTLAASAPVLRVGLEKVARYYHVVQENTLLELHADDDFVRLDYQVFDARIERRQQDAEVSVGAFCALVRHCLRRDWAPLAVHFEHSRIGPRRGYENLFDCAAVFDQPLNSILVPRTLADLPLPGADARVHAAVEQSLVDRSVAFRRAAPDGPRTDAVQAALPVVIERLLKQRRLRIDSAAAELGISVYTLRAAVRGLGVGFDELVSGVRRDMALRYLEDPDLSLTEIAETLGYSELSAFSRAFRRWTGVNALAWQQRGAGGAALPRSGGA